MAPHERTSPQVQPAPVNASTQGREHLAAWQRSRPRNWFVDNALLIELVRRYAPAEELPGILERLGHFGSEIAALEPQVHRSGGEPWTPVLERWDGIGRRQERVRHDGTHHEIGAVIYGSGVMSITGRPERAIEQAALMLLSSHHGEAGHNCPLACTAGMIKAIQRVGHPALQKALLPRLLDPRYGERLYGSQFLTEVQGGSDVGANACEASPMLPETADRPAMWRISGEKWFCSVIDAPIHLMTARPVGAAAGTRGLGLFLVPHDLPSTERVDVQPLLPLGQEPREVNHFAIRRLKNKLGTRAMASGELDWNGAHAWQLGPIDRGFYNVVEIVLDTSRLFNALATAGSMWRAFWEASTFARHRHAFGQPIADFAAVDLALGQLYAESAGATASTMDLIALEAAGTHPQALRLALNANKYWTSIRNTQMVRLAIEILGGNGAIEDFSPLPRLYRDAIVTESWEGTHNVLAAQTLRDMQRLRLHEPFLDWLGARVDQQAHPELHGRMERLRLEAAGLAVSQDPQAPIAVRTWMENAMVVLQAVVLLELAQTQQAEGRIALPPAVVAQLLALHPWREAITARGWYPKIG
jgi:acyl-CoA dehydrogenase